MTHLLIISVKKIGIKNYFQNVVAIIGLKFNRYGDITDGEQNIIPNVAMAEKFFKWPMT